MREEEEEEEDGGRGGGGDEAEGTSDGTHAHCSPSTKAKSRK